MRRLDIGIASYRNPAALRKVLASIVQRSQTDWKCFIVHNPSLFDDREVIDVIQTWAGANSRFIPVWMSKNAGYAGAINELFVKSSTEYVAYLDNDAEVLTTGWDENLCSYLDRFHEIGMIFPNGGPYPIERGAYAEVMWGVGYAWIINRLAMKDTGKFDVEIGHQNEADYCLRLRMAGWKCAAVPTISIAHHAMATNDPASTERINTGVRQFVDKWCAYFCGKNINYHSPNVMRWEDWPPNALYLEEYWKLKMSQLNVSPEVVQQDGRDYDLIKVLRLKDFYRGRII